MLFSDREVSLNRVLKSFADMRIRMNDVLKKRKSKNTIEIANLFELSKQYKFKNPKYNHN
jgi:hypothetical protein